jgi:hypothetical protein
MMAPFRIRPVAKGGVHKVNEDPKRLDDAYVRMLGPGGDKMLGDEVKWLAVTHKSFQHGKQGFNDRLAYLGTLGRNGGFVQAANTMDRKTDSRTANIASAYKFTPREPLAKRCNWRTNE